MADYVVKLRKGELELELKSDDAEFIETQMDAWRAMLMVPNTANVQRGGQRQPSKAQSLEMV
jgi:hypothetical protein